MKLDWLQLQNNLVFRIIPCPIGVKKRTHYGELAYVGSGNLRIDPRSRREMELEKENAELRKANEILKDALGFFAKDRKK